MSEAVSKSSMPGLEVMERPVSAGGRDRRPVIVHVGPLGEVPGGMAQVLHEYLAWSFPTLEVRCMASTLGRGHRWAIGRALLCLVRIPLCLLSRRRHAFVVHLSSGGSFIREGALVALAKLCRFPVAIHLHGSMFGSFAERRPRLVRTVLNLPDVIYVLSAEAERLVGEVTDPSARRPARVVKVANGVEIPDEPHGKEPVVLFAGEVGGRKGVDVLWKAWSAITAERPDWRLVVAGPVEPEIEALPTPPGVTVLGTVSREAVLNWETRSAIAVLPSRNEALPMFLLESMARGCAAVGTPVGEVAELLDGCGVVVPVDDGEGLAKALAVLMDDPVTASALGAAGRARVIETYSSTVLARMFEREWWALLDGRRRSPAPLGLAHLTDATRPAGPDDAVAGDRPQSC